MKNISNLLEYKYVNLSLILMAMLLSISATPQVSTDFTTISANAGCGSLIVEFKDLSSGSPTAWLWDFGNGNFSSLQNPTVIYNNPGLYDVKLISSNTSFTDAKISNGFITVHNNPSSNLDVSSSISGCAPLLVSFDDISSSSSSIVDWLWDFGDGGSSTSQNPIYEYQQAGEFTVSLMVFDNNGCQSIVSEVDLIKASNVPVLDFSVDINFSCNSSEMVTFTNNTLSPASFSWNFGDNSSSILPNPIHSYSTGLYDVTLIGNTGNCRDTLVIHDFIEIGTEINPDFSSNISYGCEVLSIDFSDLTVNFADYWKWDFGDGNVSYLQNPTHLYENYGIYDVTLKTSRLGQCIDSVTVFEAIEVFRNPVVEFVTDTAYGCSIPYLVNFTDMSTNAVSWNWDFGNGTSSVLNNPSVVYSNFGIYDVELTVTDLKGCVSVKSFDDLIKLEKINPNISSNVVAGCVPFSIDFIDSTNSIRPLVNWEWSFGDGNFSNIKNPTFVYDTIGVFDINLKVVNDYGCISDLNFNDYINANQAPNVQFEASPIISCIGEDINFFDLSTSNDSITNWFWDFQFGNSSILQNPITQYALPGNYDVMLIAGVNNCTDTFKLLNYIKIMTPVASFIEEYDCLNPLTVTFNNSSIGADNVFWDFGDGITSTLLNPVHTYSAKGVYDVVLTVNNILTDCVNEMTQSVKLTIPEANFDYLINSNNGYEDSIACAPKLVHLNNFSIDLDHYEVIWSDGYTGYGRLDHVFDTEGLFDVSMVVTDIHGCKDTMTYKKMFHINDVEADFGIISSIGCDSMLVNFEDLSVPSSSLFWDFGDGGISSLNNPQHIYYNEGLYDVTLYAKSIDGCIDTLKRLEYIQFQYPNADFSSDVQGVCPNDIIQFTNFSAGIGTSSYWDFGNGVTSQQINPSHSFLSNGQYTISLVIIDSFGCSDSVIMSQYIDVLKPSANFSLPSISSNCPPLMTSFTNLSSSDVSSWNWSFSDGGSSLVSSPSHLFNSLGVFDVSLIVENQYGCKDTLLQNGLIEVSGPSGSFTFSDSLVCKNDTIEFLALSSNTSSYLWDFGNGAVSSDSNPYYLYESSGIYLPILIIEDASGCQLTVNNLDSITVYSLEVEAGVNLEICEGEQVQLNASGNSSQFSWTPHSSLNDYSISSPIASPINDIIYYINYFDGICSETDSVFVKVHNDVPITDFSYINQCIGDTVKFNANSGLVSTNVSWNWSFGSNFQNPLQYLSLGINNIQLIVLNLDNNCSDTLIQDVEIFPNPIADFNVNQVCLGETTYLTNNSSNNTIDWLYSFTPNLDISTDQNPSYIYDSSGHFYTSLTVVSDMGCLDSIVKEVIVHELPIANFEIENFCEGIGNLFTDQSSINNGYLSSVSYDFNNESISPNLSINHVFDGYGSFEVELSVVSKSGCKSSIIKIAEVFAKPVVEFSALGLCLGDITKFSNVSFVDNSEINSFNWVFSEEGESFDKNPAITFSNAGTHNVILLVVSEAGCFTELNKKIRIHELPNPKFNISSDICLGDIASITDSSSVVGSRIVSWNYNFGDGSSSSEQNPQYTYNQINQFDVSLEVVSLEGCINDTTILNIVEVHALPIADFQASSLLASEIESEISFNNNSTGSISYVWSFGNGDYSSEENPTYHFNNTQTYNVQLTAISDKRCSSEIIKVVSIYPQYALFVPDAFTPNNDGNNDVFLAKGKAIIDFEMQVFDRWGGEVFLSSDIEYGWDGYDVRVNKVVPGVYSYRIILHDFNSKLWVYNGEINLIR